MAGLSDLLYLLRLEPGVSNAYSIACQMTVRSLSKIFRKRTLICTSTARLHFRNAKRALSSALAIR